MTLRPADDPGPRAQQRPVPDRQSGTQSTLTRGLGRLGDYVRTLGTRLRRLFRSSDRDLPETDDRTVDARYRRRMLEAPSPFGGDADAPELTDCPTVADLPPRERPLTVPARDESWDNQPDLTVEESDDELTLSMPEESGATITSDVWEPIDP